MSIGIIEVPYAIPWQEALSESSPPVVENLLPRGYDRYVRLFHPFISRDFEQMPRFPVDHGPTWRELAQQVGVSFAPTLTLRQVQDALPGETWEDCPWAVWEDLEESVAVRLFEALDDGEGPWFFAFGLSAIIGRDDHRPLLFSSPSLNDRQAVVDTARGEGGSSITTPEYVWPADEHWIVCSDYDLTSTYLAVPDALARPLLARDDLETVEVQPETRIDDFADEQQV